MADLCVGSRFVVAGRERIVKNWEARWSMRLSQLPHEVWLLFEGETVYLRFVSDSTGDFHDLVTPTS
jgi:hypothetical protein